MDPTTADRLVQQARQLHLDGRTDDALAALERVLASRPKHANACAMRGRIAFDLGRLGEARDWHRRAVQAAPKSPQFLCNLGNTLLAMQRGREAVTAFQRALKLDPAHAQATANLADALERRGEAEKARKLTAPLVAGRAPIAKAVLVLARAELALKEDDAVVALAERFAGAADFAPFDRGSLELLAGRALDRQGRIDEAFAAYARGNALLALPHDVAETEARFERLRAAYVPGGDLARSGNDDETAVLIVGMPRSGTTLIEQIIHAHPKGCGAGELIDLPLAIESVVEARATTTYPECMPGLSPDALDAIGHDYVERLRDYGGKAPRIVDKGLQNVEHVGAFFQALPRGRVIHARRHPMDTCLSCFMSPLRPTLHGYANDLALLGRHYRAYRAIMDHWRAVFPDAILDVQYERLVAEPEAESRRLVAFLGLEWDDACLRFHEAKRDVATLSYRQVRQPVYRSAVARHVAYDAHLGPLRDALGDYANEAVLTETT